MRVYHPDDLERDILALWEREGTFAASLERRAHAPRYGFYDGPPYATGTPHYGHLLQSSIKDAVTRYWTMRGYLVDRRIGWDCHGLPIENLVEKELGITNKKEIEERGVEAFNAACRSVVLRNVNAWASLLQRVGRWAEYAHAYATMDATFMESVWWVFKVVWDQGFVTKGLRSSPYCPRCETPLSHFETTLGYADVTDPAITVKVRLADEPQSFLLIWTTTPWTLPGNAAIAVHPELTYAKVRVGDELWIVAEGRVADVVREPHTVDGTVAGGDLVGRAYEPLFSFVEPDQRSYRVVAASFVNPAEGTGLVHIAPAFGEEDFRLGEELGLPLRPTVDGRGRFLPVVAPWTGLFVKNADAAIIGDLRTRGFLVRSEELLHAYPHCWRCGTPLIYFATTSWFIAVAKIKEQLLDNAAGIRWVPDHLKDGRFGQGLRDAPDWAISRTRYWGTPVPVWECTACGKPTVVGSLNDLEAAGGDRALLQSPHAAVDLHRPYVDRVVLRCAHCGGEARRVPEVLDVWFDSGSMPYGQWHYPFENKERVEATFPADCIGEALEQTRGWFYTLHVLAGVLTLPGDRGGPSTSLGVNQPAFRNAVASGLILAEDGRKLSKSLQNYPDPSGLLAKYGADSIRLYLLSATKLGEDTRFSDRLVGELYRRFTLIVWNVWQFYRTYGGGEHGKKSQVRDPLRIHFANSQEGAVRRQSEQGTFLDRWILARTRRLVADVKAAMDAYHPDDAARALVPFMDDVSTWYVRRSRGRAEALPVLGEVLRTFSLVASPFLPFLAEHIHRELTGRSPHLEDWPSDGDRSREDEELIAQCLVIRDLASAGQRARADANIRVRQPLAEAVIVGDVPALAAVGEEGLTLLRDEWNVKSVRVLPVSDAADVQQRPFVWVELPEGKVGLMTERTPELIQEGIVRDLIRHVQDLRKQAKYRFDDTVILSVVTDDPAVRAAVERFAGLLKEETKAREFSFEKGVSDVEAEVIVGRSNVWLGTRR